MADHQQFQDAMATDPTAPGPHRVDADWLDERGSPLGVFVRAAAAKADVSGITEPRRLPAYAAVTARDESAADRQLLERHLDPTPGQT
jgi:uncharacterized protein (TIGR02996 family)